jgi:hypothetical protein
LTYAITGGSLVFGDTLSGLLVRTPGEDVGDYSITQGTLANSNYAITFVGGEFHIEPVAAIPALREGDSPRIIASVGNGGGSNGGNTPVDSFRTSQTTAPSGFAIAPGEAPNAGAAPAQSDSYCVETLNGVCVVSGGDNAASETRPQTTPKRAEARPSADVDGERDRVRRGAGAGVRADAIAEPNTTR